MQQLRTAVIGATGNVGREVIRLMQDAPFISENPVFLASSQSTAEEIVFLDESFPVSDVAAFDFKDIDLAIFATDAVTSRQYVPKALENGAFVIDCSSAFRLDTQARLVLPELNAKEISTHHKLYSIPDAATTQLALVLHALEKKARIKRVDTTVMMSVSSAGRDAMDELYTQSAALIGGAGAEQAENFHFPVQMAFNVLPQVGGFEQSGMTTAEQAMLIEANKLLNGTIPMAVTCVHVPTFIGISQAVNVELEQPITPHEARDLFEGEDFLQVLDNPDEQEYSTPFGAAETDPVFISRLREDRSRPNSLSMWLVMDNLRKGSALTVLQIAEQLADNS